MLRKGFWLLFFIGEGVCALGLGLRKCGCFFVLEASEVFGCTAVACDEQRTARASCIETKKLGVDNGSRRRSFANCGRPCCACSPHTQLVARVFFIAIKHTDAFMCGL